MDEELDGIEAEEERHSLTGDADQVAEMLGQVQSLRSEGKVSEARDLLYKILEQGSEDQRMVARNILSQLDED